MSSIKCPNCGLINFATATACKRCKQNLEGRSDSYCRDNGPVQPLEPDWSKFQTFPSLPAENLVDYGDGGHPVGNILFAIYLVLTMIVTLYALHFSSSESREFWKVVTDPNSKLYLASFEPMYYLLLLGAVVSLLATVILLVTLCLKSKAFLRWILIYLLVEFVYFILEIWTGVRLEGELRETHIPQLELAADAMQWVPYLSIIGILFTFVWLRYFTTSERARSVFQ